MNQRVNTVVIKGENGPVLINESDFDESKHELATKKQTEAAQTAPTPAQVDTVTLGNPNPELNAVVADPAAAQQVAAAATDPALGQQVVGNATGENWVVVQDGKNHFVESADGVRAKNVKGISGKGYATAAEAWEAIMTVNAEKASGE